MRVVLLDELPQGLEHERVAPPVEVYAVYQELPPVTPKHEQIQDRDSSAEPDCRDALRIRATLFVRLEIEVLAVKTLLRGPALPPAVDIDRNGRDENDIVLRVVRFD